MAHLNLSMIGTKILHQGPYTDEMVEHCSMCLLVISVIHGILLCVAYESEAEICLIQFCLEGFFVS